MDESFPTILVMFGATGDLAKRKLIPALWQLYQANRLPKLWQVVGVSRQDLSDEDWQTRVKEIIHKTQSTNGQTKHKSKNTKAQDIDAFVRLFVYQTGDFEDAAGYKALAERLGRKDDAWQLCANKLFYLAVPPQYYQTIFQHLADSGLTEPCSEDEGWTRVIVEKPFGKDLATAKALDAKLGELFQEEQIYRIDHYLGKETARNILAFRFSNSFLKPAWNNRSIAGVHVQFPEELKMEGRGRSYDEMGALRDVGQNHMLQLLALFLMNNPGRYDADSIRRERTRVLRALEIMDKQDVAQRTQRGQYKGYREEEGVDRKSERETYFRVETKINLPEWRGVPIFLESGKGMGETKFEIVVEFRHQTPCLCPADQHYTNHLRYRVQPDEGVFMNYWVKKPGTEMEIEEKEFSFDYHQSFEKDVFIDAYEKLLLDAIKGDQTLFVSTDEIEASWKFIDPIEAGWKEGLVELEEYEVGSHGPPVASPAAKAMGGAQPDKAIGLVGLGKMGSNMAERLTEHGWAVTASDPSKEARDVAEKKGATVVETASDVVSTLRQAQGKPDEGVLIWLMVPHQVVDEVLGEISYGLEEGDVVIDGGNSFYKDSIRRSEEMGKKGVHYLDIGVSGGPSGARDGACLMIGGSQEIYKKHVGLFADLSVAAGFDYMGESGAGHFVKMVHNGIEYGMMQAIGEGFDVMKSWPKDLDLEAIADLYNHGSVIESSLVGWLKEAYEKYGAGLDDISGTVAHSGEGQWTVEAAKELGIPVPIIEGALKFRVKSANKPSYTGQVVSALRNMFGGHDVKKK